MARYAPRLPIHSSSGNLPEIELTPIQWLNLENIACARIEAEARANLEALCNQHFKWKDAENAQTWNDVAALLEQVKKAGDWFTRLSFGELIPHTDAGRELQSHINSALESFPALVENYVDGKAVQIRVNLDCLMKIGISLTCAIRETNSKIEEYCALERDGFMPGDAFREWLIQISAWAKESGLQYGIKNKDDTPAKFSRFVFALNRMFPTAFQENVNSEDAMSKRIKAARKSKRDQIPPAKASV